MLLVTDLFNQIPLKPIVFIAVFLWIVNLLTFVVHEIVERFSCIFMNSFECELLQNNTFMAFKMVTCNCTWYLVPSTTYGCINEDNIYWTSVRLYFTSAVSLNLNTNLCNWGIIRVLLTLYGRLSGFAIAMRSRKENHSEGQCREWRAVYYTGGPMAESSLAKDPDQLLWKPYIPVYCSSPTPQIP